MAGLCFHFAELSRETLMLQAMARHFLDSNTEWVLTRFLDDLKGISKRGGEGKQTLQLQSLHTIPSRDYETGSRQGGKDVYAAISGTWDLRPLGAKPSPGRLAEFCGIASTRIELYATDEPHKRLAKWQLDLGAHDAPGCYFHAQIPWGFDSKKPPLRTIPIPRLPCIFVTPMSAVEFALGELFHDKWGKVTAQNTAEALRWRSLQQVRLQKLFSWYQGHLKDLDRSPWMALKKAKPEGPEFVME